MNMKKNLSQAEKCEEKLEAPFEIRNEEEATNVMVVSEMKETANTYQIISFWIFTEKGFSFFLLLPHKVFNIYIKTGRSCAFWALCRLFTFFK